MSPMWLNLSSGIATIWPPKPRKPPILSSIAVFRPGSMITLWTLPRSAPSDDLAASPTKLPVAAGATAFFSAGVVSFVGYGEAGGGDCGVAATGGLSGVGGGDCVCAITVATGTATRTAVVPMIRAGLVTDIIISFAVWIAPQPANPLS